MSRSEVETLLGEPDVTTAVGLRDRSILETLIFPNAILKISKYIPFAPSVLLNTEAIRYAGVFAIAVGIGVGVILFYLLLSQNQS